MRKELLTFCAEKGILLDNKILNIFEKLDDINVAKNLIERVNYQYNQKMITSSFFMNNQEKVLELISNYSKSYRKIVENFFINLGVNVVDLNDNYNQTNSLDNNSLKKVDNLDLGVNIKKMYENYPEN